MYVYVWVCVYIRKIAKTAIKEEWEKIWTLTEGAKVYNVV